MKKLLLLLASLAMIACIAFAVPACNIGDLPLPDHTDEDKGSVDDIKDKVENQGAFEMSASADEGKITLKVSGGSDKLDGATASVVSMKAYEYYTSDNLHGLSADLTEGEVICEYDGTSAVTQQLDRFAEDGYDRLYNKYYLVSDGAVLKGPVYATEITPEVSTVPEYISEITTKKGGHGVSVTEVAGVNGRHATIDFEISSFIYPNEIVNDDGTVIELPAPAANATSFVSMGKTYYFNSNLVGQFDAIARQGTDNGVDIIAVVYPNNRNITADSFPLKMTYYPYSTQDTITVATNTSNSYGFEYWIALMEFFASRYSGGTDSKGYISTYVLGNEVDYAPDYFRISEKDSTLDEYMEEYGRLLRLSNLAVKKYNSNVTVSGSFTHAWAKAGASLASRAVRPYAPKLMIDWLNTKTKLEGDYDWGISTHPYCFTLSTTRVFEYDTKEGVRNKGMTADFNTTSTISYTNLELLQQYLDQDELKFDGQVRSVHLTESGISSSGYYSDNGMYKDENGVEETVENAERIQAGIIAATWYKVSQLDCIKDYCYFPIVGHGGNGTTYDFGLVYSPAENGGRNKLSYEVWLNVDTQYSFNYANRYLPYIRYYDKEGNLVTYGNGIESYLDLLDIYGTGYDFSDFDYEKACPVKSEEYIPQFEDKIDMTGISFEGASHLYLGEEDDDLTLTAAVKGELPEGVTVKIYDEEGNETDSPTLTGRGVKKYTAVFFKGEEEVSRRTATLSNTRMYTDKTVYKLGDSIYVTIDRSDYAGESWDGNGWIGLVREYADITKTPSVYWFYFNKNGDDFIHTYNLLEGTRNSALIEGEYTLYMFDNFSGGPDHIVCQTHISVLPEDTTYPFAYDLSGVKFVDQDLKQDPDGEEPVTMTAEGNLPAGITVEYEGNVQTELGDYQAVAIFKKDGVEIERRYAVLTVSPSDRVNLQLEDDRTEFFVGEQINVTAYAPKNSGNRNWWVGVYEGWLDDKTDYSGIGSISYYYVLDSEASRTSGSTVDICSLMSGAYLTSRDTRDCLAYHGAGKYTIVLIASSGYTPVDMYIQITVKEAPASVAVTNSDDNVFEYGEDIKVTAEITPDLPNQSHYWVGLYMLDSKNDYTYPGAPNCSLDPMQSIIYYYVADATHVSGGEYILQEQIISDHFSGTGTNIPGTELAGGKWNIPAGRYKLLLFSQENGMIDAYLVAQSQIFEVRPENNSSVEIVGDKTTFTKGEQITVNVKSDYRSSYTTNWIGLYGGEKGEIVNTDGIASENYAYFAYLPATQATMTIDTSTLSAGTYKIVLFWDGHYGIDPTFDFITITITEG